MYTPANKKPKPFVDFVDPLLEIRESIHRLGEEADSDDGAYLKLYSRTLEAAIKGGLRENDFVFKYDPEKRQRVFMTILRKGKDARQRTAVEGAVMQLVHEINVICEEAECAVLEWFPAQVACWNLLKILTQEFVKGTHGAFFSTTTRISNLFEAAQNGLERIYPIKEGEELVFE